MIKTVEYVLEKKKRKSVCCLSHLLFEDDRETLAMQTPPPISGIIIFLACEKCKIYCTQVTIKTVKPPRLFERVVLFQWLEVGGGTVGGGAGGRWNSWETVRKETLILLKLQENKTVGSWCFQSQFYMIFSHNQQRICRGTQLD